MEYRISRLAAIEALHELFRKVEGESASPDELVAYAGRGSDEKELSKRWLANRLTPLRHYGLIESVREDANNRKTVTAIVLTQDGIRALCERRSNGMTLESGVTAERLFVLAIQFRLQHSDFSVDLSVTYKGDRP
jgi:hypothetical protein